jgi:hypothetical protein
MFRFSSERNRPLLQLLTLPTLVLTLAVAGCGSNAPDNAGAGSNTGTGPGGTIPPTNEPPTDAGTPPPTERDAGTIVNPVVDAGTPAIDAGVADAGSAYRYGSCLQTMQCFQTAACYRSACSAPCLNESAPDIRDEATALLACVELNNCGSDTQCIGQKCMSEASACGMAGEGTATCAQTMMCAIGCGQGDFTCYGGCLGGASAGARQKVQAIIGCALRNQCGTDQTCIMTRCGTEVQACLGA